jgi:hypothetical protein
MRLSLKKGAHADVAPSACRKFGVSRLLLARCGKHNGWTGASGKATGCR